MKTQISHSRFVQRVRRRYAAELPLFAAVHTAYLSPEAIAAGVKTLLQQGRPLAQALRITRHLALLHVAEQDTEHQATLSDVTHSMTHLAEVCLQLALQDAYQRLDLQHGQPQLPSGARCPFWVLGMGKLGARELNVSSDIDLIYVYQEEGETAGRADGGGRISHHEYFAKVARELQALIGDNTEHGQVFRLDLALRPNGQSGPTCVSLDMLETYFQVQGREWERFAWLKSRVVAPQDPVSLQAAKSLRDLIMPFVFRRYLDYGVFDSLRHLHQQIRDHAAQQSAGRPERGHDVKLSRGGIREIEFTVQLLQVVRGGQFPELRTRSTLEALERLAKAGLMSVEAAQRLARAYVFLRRVEHRIQYLDDQQTHLLPTQDEDLNWIAATMHLQQDSCGFLCELAEHREAVASEFDALLQDHRPSAKSACKACSGEKSAATSLQLQDCPSALRTRIEAWLQHPRVLALRDTARERLLQLMVRTVEWLREHLARFPHESWQAGQGPEQAALRFMDWLEPLLRRESYLALLIERPAVHDRLLRLMGLARWSSRYLMTHPGVIDELASMTMLDERFDRTAFEAELQSRYEALARSGQLSEEALLEVLRRAHHAETFRTLARDLEGRLQVEQVADDLSALADAVLHVALRWIWGFIKLRINRGLLHDPRFAVIAYGKLGGKELGYGSDLDLVFLFDDPHESAQEVYAAYARKLVTWLTLQTPTGTLFEIDTALRPNGNAGLLVTSLQAFEEYQHQRGSNTAWTWEHQAITRARCVTGAAHMAARFDAVRAQVLCAPREVQGLRQQVRDMRERVRQAHVHGGDLFDVKHDPGGMVDVEFAVQTLVLLHSAAHPELAVNAGNIALLKRAQALGLLPAGVGDAAASAYSQMRALQHRARLDERPTQFEALALQAQREAVLALWRAVMT